MEIKIDMRDVEDLIKQIGEAKVEKTLERAIYKSVLTLEREAKVRTPVVTGLLRNSYETKFGRLEGRLRNFREYAPFVEYRRHFMENAVTSTESKIKTIFDDEIDILLTEAFL